VIQKLETSKKISFARVDADHINNLIKKDEPIISKLNETEKESLKKNVEEAFRILNSQFSLKILTATMLHSPSHNLNS
jgi:molecular chaperone HtpG